MYCPRCSQQQLPGGARFCSGCGLQLMGVSQLLRTDGMAYIQTRERLPLIKRPQLRKGVKLMFLSFFSFFPSLILAGILDHGLPLAIPLIPFLAGFAQVIYYFLFGESILPIKEKSVYENQHQLNYQPEQSLPFYSRSYDTAEFAPPPSITEPTANLYRK